MKKMEFRLGEDTIITVDGPMNVGPIISSPPEMSTPGMTATIGDISSAGQYVPGETLPDLESIFIPKNSNSPGTAIKYKAAKNDQQKSDLSLLPKVFLEEVAKAFMVGEKKYGRYNYCKGHDASQLVAALMRHATAWFNGEEHDPVDGQHHLGSVGACVAMILRQQELCTLKDNRFKGDKNGDD